VLGAEGRKPSSQRRGSQRAVLVAQQALCEVEQRHCRIGSRASAHGTGARCAEEERCPEAQAKALDSSAHSNGADSGSSADLPAELAGRHPVDRVVDAMICFTECNMMPALNEQLIKGRLAGGLLPSDIQLSTLTMLVESVAAETPADSPCGQPCMPPADHGRRAAAPWCAAAPVGMPDLGLRLVCALDLGCARTVLDVQHLVRIEVAQHRAGEQCQQAQQQHGAAEEKTAAATPPPRAAL